jgi:hypothetical protein
MAKKCTVEDCNYPVFSRGYCKIHQRLRKDKKPKAPIKQETIETLNGKTEIDIFNEIWEERPHVSELSGKPLPYDKTNMKMWVCQFLHVINKGRSPSLRLDKRNILLGTPEEHRFQDQYEIFKIRKIEMLRKLYVK